MKVLVTGATGKIGSLVVQELVKRGAEVRALARKQPEPGKLPQGIEVTPGDLRDSVSVVTAMQGVDKLFLLIANAADELMQALMAYGLAKRIGLKHVTYLSVFKVEQFRDVPHFASKLAVENAIREFGVPYTILRPGYFIQNDDDLKEALTGSGIYPVPVGTQGIAIVDARDIGEAAAISLTQEGHAGKTYDLVNGELHTGPKAAAIWSRLLSKEIKYAGHDFDAFEAQSRNAGRPSWLAYDIRTMFQGYFDRGFAPTQTEADRLTTLLGHDPRSYEAHAEELAKEWGYSTLSPRSSRSTGRSILAFGKHPEIAAAAQQQLRSLGFQATVFALTNDEAGDARLVAELKRAEYDGVAIGAYINGQDPVNYPATEETAAWFNRVLNIVHVNAPNSKIILARAPEDIVPAIERVLGTSVATDAPKAA
jgi:uncharacterized protein YbjT (DUF2867 family)